jgi:hypothetical protein
VKFMHKIRIWSILLLILGVMACSEEYTIPVWETQFVPPDNLKDVELWDTCPAMTPTAAPTEGEYIWVQSTPDAIYCSRKVRHFEGENGEGLEEAFDVKSQMRVVPGDFFLPLQLGSQPVSFPVCTLFADHDDSPVAFGDGSLRMEEEMVLNRPRLNGRLEQPLMVEGKIWTFEMYFTGFRDVIEHGFQLNGSHWSRSTDPEVIMRLCEGVACDGAGETLVYDACDYQEAPTERHTIGFGDDHVIVSVANYGSPWRVEGDFIRAEGELAGLRFEQSSYWKLAMGYTHQWGESRDFQINFDHPINIYCGLRIIQAWPYSNYDYGTRVEKMTCDGATIEASIDYAVWEEMQEDEDQE